MEGLPPHRPSPLNAKEDDNLKEEELKMLTKHYNSQRGPNASSQLNTFTNNHTTTFQDQKYSKGEFSSSTERRSAFKKGIYCGHCGKEGHTKVECYKIVGYPVGHPLHGKFPAKQSTRQQTDTRNFKSVNTVSGQTDHLDAPTIQSQQETTSTIPPVADHHVSARMDQLQNQLNQPIDSGASDHIAITLDIMSNIYSFTKPIYVTLPNGQNTKVTQYGSVTLNAHLTLHNVLYIPTFSYNLISVSQLLKGTNCSLILTATMCIFQDQDQRIALGSLCNGLYLLDKPPSHPSTHSAFTITSNQHLWHSRLGHSSPTVLKQITSLSDSFSCNSNFHCTICPLAKHHSLPFNESLSYANSLFELIHIDVWGPYRHTTINKCKYFLTIVDDHSRATWTYLMPSKQHAISNIKAFYFYIQNHFQITIKTVRSDNGTEFLNSSLSEFFSQHGIHHQTSCPYTPQQNARVERKHKQLLEIARAIKIQANFPIHLWGYCVLAATYIINRLPSRAIQNKSPFEILYNKPPNLTNLKVIGCRAYLHHNTTYKFDQRAIPRVLVGYPNHQKGYILYDPTTHKSTTSRHVTFDESIFPFHEHHTPSTQNPTPSTSFSPIYTPPPSSEPNTTTTEDHNTTSQPQFPSPTTSPSPEPHHITTPTHSPDLSPNTTSSTSTSTQQPSTTTPSPTIEVTDLPPPPPPTRASTRTKKLPSKLNDYHHTLNKSKVNSVSKHHYSHFINYKNIHHPKHRHLINVINHTQEPHTYKQAAKNPRWIEVMNKELYALEENQTWELVLHPLAKFPLVASGSIGSNFMQMLDVNNAFLHGGLHEEVYMVIPPGYTKSTPPNTVCKLKKSLYGLKQANRQWFTKLTTFLISFGFVQSYADTSLFTITKDTSFTALLVYVDDILITGNNQTLINTVKEQLHQAFSIKDLGPLHYYLGIEILRNKTGLIMSQRKYALELLQTTNVLNDKPSVTPLNPQVQLNDTEGELLSDPSLYRTLVGKLIYLTITRPYISFAAQLLSQFSHAPRTTHMKALLRVLRYIKLSHGQGLHIPSNTNHTLLAYCDRDWAACPTTRRSVSGYAIFLDKCFISWSSKKQSVVSRSSTEAEYRALADCTCEITWLKCLFKDLHISLNVPTKINCENASTIALASNPIQHARTKHIELDCHFVRDKVREGSIPPTFIPTKLQAADVLTKGLCKVLHYNCLSKYGMCDPYTLPTWGGGGEGGRAKDADPNTTTVKEDQMHQVNSIHSPTITPQPFKYKLCRASQVHCNSF
ncbi:hypothetical protein CTI12_AA069020 [Artemisia annua]|uniref:Uncharacterized protein n=1 Tax=Artemisia annua TaxID=35608 RepID=A0A2U1Q6I9_ARTAN|nr:hypothetical protein CTI12_AA069020 [Artemisia annua]